MQMKTNDTSGDRVDAYMTKRQLSEYLGLSARTIEHLVQARKLPCIRLTQRSVRFRRAAVDAALSRLEQKAFD